ncbi:MAG: Dam family site-specific DNA-(adenine-N6)-methyltransferase [Kiritimatiellae bacterium]|nr:Dam family site-specific DNA-(adenine-N6)-methyltransferase [Kiritimatiellia bacterium]
MRIIVPPIKSQGIKTRLVPWINEIAASAGIAPAARWIEPFFGTGAVGFNSPFPGLHVAGDTNPHTIAFYKAVQDGTITGDSMRAYLKHEGAMLEGSANGGDDYFKTVRARFNKSHDPYDFLFLSRAGFNGMMRFNSRGAWNVPFCKKSGRFSPAYITKICNQIDAVARQMRVIQWDFRISDFADTIAMAGQGDFIYCDPPYYGRYADYYNTWTAQDEHRLFDALSSTRAKFVLSTWHHNDYRANEMMNRFWHKFNIATKDHFYHNGAKIENRHAVVEALVFNFDLQNETTRKSNPAEAVQLELFAEAV